MEIKNFQQTKLIGKPKNFLQKIQLFFDKPFKNRG